MGKPILLEVFSDYVYPWYYLDDKRIKRLQQDYNIPVQLVHYSLHPGTPPEGRT